MNKYTSIYNRIADVILLFQPVFPVPLYFTVLMGNPPFWVSLIISLIPFVLRYQHQKILFKRTIFDFPILIFIIGSAVGFFIATNKDTATGALISLLASILIYYGMTSNSDRGKKYWISLGAIIIFISLIFSVWFFSQGQSKQFLFNQWTFDMFKSVPKSPGVSLGLHGIGALFSAVIPVALGALLFSRNKKYRIWLAVLSLLLAFILFLSVSGGGWIAFSIGVIFILICWRRRSLFFLIPISGLIIGLFLFYYSKTIWLPYSFSNMAIPSRYNLWVNTVPLLGDLHSFFGLGLGNWAEVYNNYYHSAEIHMHNNYFQIYTDMGIFGVLAISFAIVIFSVTAYKIMKSSGGGILKGLGIGLIGSFLGGAFFNMLDVTLTGTIKENGSYIYLSIPFLWIWAAFYSVTYYKLFSKEKICLLEL